MTIILSFRGTKTSLIGRLYTKVCLRREKFKCVLKFPSSEKILLFNTANQFKFKLLDIYRGYLSVISDQRIDAIAICRHYFIRVLHALITVERKSELRIKYKYVCNA